MAIELPPKLAQRYGVTPASDENLRYRVLRSFCVGDGVDLAVGQEVSLPKRIASQWVATGRLALVVAAAVRDSDEMEHADPDLEHGDSPAPRTRRRPKTAE